MKPKFNKTKTENPKIIINTYEKEFEDNFFNMIDEIRTLHPEINNIVFRDEINNVIEASEDVLNYITAFIPNACKGKNLKCSLSISANKVMLKTNKFFSVGWKYKYDINGNLYNIVGIISIFTREGIENKDIIDMETLAKEKDWKLVEK